jgi:hypothetical protein
LQLFLCWLYIISQKKKTIFKFETAKIMCFWDFQ